MARASKAKTYTEAEVIERFRLAAVRLTGDGEDLATFAVDGQTHRLTPARAIVVAIRVEAHVARIAKNTRSMLRLAETLRAFVARPAPRKPAKRSRR
ncbi:MAG: hypothetical protein JNL56_12290 [Alphaproteobacteria bacterium]|nr:hypothetical protein [Alphaproteobacteria bacterium]